MAKQTSVINFHDGFQGEFVVGGQTIKIGRDAVRPYDMTFGALASCMYATFLDWARKKDVTVGDVEVVVTGEKRTEVPTTLAWVNVAMTAESGDSYEAVKECMDLAMRDCSMIQTVAKVAEMTHSLELK